MVSTPPREQLLQQLAEYRLPIEPTLAALREYPWDSDVPLFTVTREHIRTMLRRYLSGELTADQLTDWADLLECRDDITYEPASYEPLRQVIFELANPNLNAEISPEVAREIEQRITDAPTI
jgi:hypothetical protein